MMSSKTFHQVSEFSLSKVTARSVLSEAVIALGKKIVSELQLDDSVDTLGRWMAHYVAELIQDLEDVPQGADRSGKQTQLRDAILALWARRFELPSDIRPFIEFEPILRALESLDPENTTSRYFSTHRAPVNECEESETTMRWIELAKSIDYTSKVLIDHCLISAADSALDKSKEWIELAKNAGIDDSFEFFAIRFIADHRDLMKKPDANGHQRQILAERLQKLEVFSLQATNLANDIKAQLDILGSTEDNSNLSP